MRIIGITGCSGSGKSYICSALESLGYTIIDADKIAREIVQPGQPALNELTIAFGNEILFENGTLNRKRLASIAFPVPENLETLNRITHKYIKQHVIQSISECKTEYCVIDAPLLYESKLNQLCDLVIGISAERSVRFLRICERDNMTAAEANRRLDAQKSIEENIKFADFCVDTTHNPLPMVLAHKIDNFIKGVSDENS